MNMVINRKKLAAGKKEFCYGRPRSAYEVLAVTLARSIACALFCIRIFL